MDLIVYNINNVQLKVLCKGNNFESFQYMVVEIKWGLARTKLLLLYHPPPNGQDGQTNTVFLRDFLACMEDVTTTYGELIICGDFNLRINNLQDVTANKLIDTMSAMGYRQLVNFETHRLGNTLDLIFSQCNKEDSFIKQCTSGPFISDHCAVLFQLPSIYDEKKPLLQHTYRNLKNLNKTELSNSMVETFKDFKCGEYCVNETLEILENKIMSELNKHAPLKTKTMRKRELKPWFDEEVRQQRKITKKSEVKWKKRRSKVLWTAYQMERRKYISILRSKRKDTLSQKVIECGKDSRKLYRLVSNITGVHKDNPMPVNISSQKLADSFADFFMAKIEKIRNDLKTSHSISQQ